MIGVIDERLKAVRSLRRDDVRRLIHMAAQRLPFTVYVHQRFCWTEMDLGTAPVLPLPEGLVLTSAGVDDLGALRELGAWFERSRDWLDAGHELWLVRDGERPVGSFWVFHGMAPTDSAPHGWVSMPDGMINIEDTVTDPEYRGRGIAPAMYSQVYDRQKRSGRAEMVIGGVPEANHANRRAVAKSGWREFALVDVKKYGLIRRGRDWRNREDPGGRFVRTRLSVGPVEHPDPEAAGALRAWLEAALRAETPAPR